MLEENNKEKLNLVCPHCGNREHFYQKMAYSGMSEFVVNNHGRAICHTIHRQK